MPENEIQSVHHLCACVYACCGVPRTATTVWMKVTRLAVACASVYSLRPEKSLECVCMTDTWRCLFKLK